MLKILFLPRGTLGYFTKIDVQCLWFTLGIPWETNPFVTDKKAINLDHLDRLHPHSYTGLLGSLGKLRYPP